MKVGMIGAGSIAGIMASTSKRWTAHKIMRWLPGTTEGQLNLHKSMVLRKPVDLMRNWWRMPG